MDAPKPTLVGTCGTRAVVRVAVGEYRVVCATCNGGGSIHHHTREAAMRAAIRDSNKPCPARPSCGAS